MKNITKFFVLAIASILGLAACQQEIAPEKPATATHTVTFVAETPQTKTTATITDGVVKYNWTEDDANTEGKFRVFENGNEAGFVLAQLEEDGRMNITATFMVHLQLMQSTLLFSTQEFKPCKMQSSMIMTRILTYSLHRQKKVTLTKQVFTSHSNVKSHLEK